MVEPPTHTQTSTRSTTYTHGGNILTVKVHFCDAQQRYGFVNIDPKIIDRLGITSETILTQEITENGILLKRFKEDI